MTAMEKIRKLRTDKGMTIYQLSKDTGITQNHISDLENGRRNPSLDTLRRLIVPLGISLSELFCEDETVTYLSEKERVLVENYRSLPEEKGKLLLEMSNALNK